MNKTDFIKTPRYILLLAEFPSSTLHNVSYAINTKYNTNNAVLQSFHTW